MTDFTPHTAAYIDQSFAWVADPSPSAALPQEPSDAATEEFMDAVLSEIAHAVDEQLGNPRTERPSVMSRLIAFRYLKHAISGEEPLDPNLSTLIAGVLRGLHRRED